MVHLMTTTEKKAILLAMIIIVLYLAPLYVLGEDAHIRVHDNLDSNIAWYKVLIQSGEWFGSVDASINQVINGLPRNTYGTEYSGIVALHALFPPMLAYSISQSITRFIAFLGMYILLRTHFIKEHETWPIRVFVALAFALTPFWPSGVLSTMGHPLALWAFLNIRSHRHSWKEWLTLALLPLYASFVLGFFFFLFAMGALWIRDLLVRRRWNPLFLGSIVFMTLIFLLVDYRFVYSLLMVDEPSSRLEFVSSRLGFWHSFRLSFKNFILGHHHVATIHTFIILPLSLIVLLLIAFRPTKNNTERVFLKLFGINLLLSVWYAYWFHKAWQPLKEQFSLLNTFNFARFHFLKPLIIYLSFALCCLIIWNLGRRGKVLIIGCLVAQILILFLFNEEILHRKLKAPTFQQFYAVKQFDEIKTSIGLPQETYRIASIGLHPAIAQYNGFYTLDTYNNFYPLDYKYQFREIIAKELGKSKKLKKYYDTWGSRCYIFVEELGKKYDYRKNSTKQIHHLELGTEAFIRMGGRYIFSAIPIVNAAENRLRLFEIFDHNDSAWRIYVYEAI